ncbi:universal stress protein [Hyphococcus sp. DH-69]|uniref:universal stress protein n=1 Tax=Hyphococcus formosus TaxID=3143534 RepID=UPI00398B62F2
MTLQNILVPFQNIETGVQAFNTATLLAKHFKVHLNVVHIRQKFPLPAGYYYPIAGTYFQESMNAETAGAGRLANELKTKYEELCEQRGIARTGMGNHDESLGTTASWDDLYSNYSFDFAREARLADLAVVARTKGTPSTDNSAMIEELIFQSARPVLIDTAAGPIAEFPKTVVVAWDGGREAARALSAIIPMLKEAETVFVSSIGELEPAAALPERAAAFLRLHGIHALPNHPSVRKGQSREERFLEHAENRDADMIVMGAYSHSRWREVILGGFTKFMLHHANTPIVMAH